MPIRANKTPRQAACDQQRHTLPHTPAAECHNNAITAQPAALVNDWG